MLKKIERASGDASVVRVTVSDDARLDDVTAVQLAVYTSADKSSLVETLDAGAADYSPSYKFTPLNADWTGTRYCQLVLVRSSGNIPIAELIQWVQT